MIPTVTGISPREGCPGTKIVIRGENLGSSSLDLMHVYVGAMDVACSLQWFSPKKVTILSSLGEGVMKIIVVTKSGGTGTCDVDYIQSVSQNIGPQEEVTYWPPNEHRNHQVLMSHSKQAQSKHMQSEMLEDIHSLGMENLPVNIALSDDDLLKLYKGRGSTQMTEPDFNPVLYLLKYHYETSYKDLLKTLENFQRTMANEKVKEPVSIVKANLFSIFQCLECLEALKKKMDDEKTTKRSISGAFVEAELNNSLNNCKQMAHQMYEEVLKRRVYADSARSAHLVMQRYSFLFNLPHSIRENIKKSEYNLVINDYLRARSLFGSSNVQLFQQVYKDVEGVISNFQGILRQQLVTMPIKCENAKNTIKLLKQLDIDYDPTWLCLETQKDWMLSMLGKMSTSNLGSYLASSVSSSNVASTGISSQVSVNSGKENPSSTPYHHYHHHQSLHPIVECTQHLTQLMTEHLLELYQLASYYSDQDNIDKSDLESIISTVISAFSTKIRELSLSLDKHTTNQQTGGTSYSAASNWLIYCLQQIRSAVDTGVWAIYNNSNLIGGIRLLSESAMQSMTKAVIDLRLRAVRSLLVKAESDVLNLSYKENWNAEITDGKGSVTRLPSQYQSIIRGALAEISRILNIRHQIEINADENPAQQQLLMEEVTNDDDDRLSVATVSTITPHAAQISIGGAGTGTIIDSAQLAEWLTKAMCAYVECSSVILDKLLSSVSGNNNVAKVKSRASSITTNENALLNASSASVTTNTSEGSGAFDNAGAGERVAPGVNIARLLLIMTNNVHHCEIDINPGIYHQLGAINSISLHSTQIHEKVSAQFHSIHQQLVQAYIQMKVGPRSGLRQCVQSTIANYRFPGIKPIRELSSSSSSSESPGVLVCILSGLLSRVHAEIMVLLHPTRLAGSVMARLVYSGNLIGWIKEELDKSSVGLSDWGRQRLGIDLLVLENLIGCLSSSCAGAGSGLDDWSEVKSLVNLMLNRLKLTSKEKVDIKARANAELNGMQMLVQGLKNPPI